MDSQVSQTVFGSLPPHGALARIAWRLGIQLHARNKAYGWASKDSSSGTSPAGAKPVVESTRLVKGRKTVITKKVKAHLRTLVSDRKLEGLWCWRRMAKALRVAGIPVHTGTVPVERLWNSLKDFFPRAGRRMSLPWWELLARLGYMRFNYRHFNHAALPTFTDGDALLAERVESLLALAREMQACADGDDTVLQGLRRALDKGPRDPTCDFRSSLREAPCPAGLGVAHASEKPSIRDAWKILQLAPLNGRACETLGRVDASRGGGIATH